MSRAHEFENNLTFIGDKEYQEATTAIATYWKYLLDSNPTQQILAPQGYIHDFEVSERDSKPYSIKSNDYVLDGILAQFNDNELSHYSGRLITRPEDVTTDNENLKTIFVDDWMLSGKEMRQSTGYFGERHKDLIPTFEVQLITASINHIRDGLVDEENDEWKYFGVDGESIRDALPIRAYYQAHNSAYLQYYDYGLRIASAHSATDFGFLFMIDSNHEVIDSGEVNDRLVEWLDTDISKKEEAAYNNAFKQIALAHIKKPYQDENYQLTNIDRLHAFAM